MKLTIRPLTDRAFVGAHPRTRSQFTATWSSTLDLLKREVYAIQSSGMPDPVLMMDITESDLRIDGQVKANARPSSSAVAIAFESRRGPLVFRADRYNDLPWGGKGSRLLWQHNVRAIALTLEALRAVDRYGATQSGEQYVGYRQITAPGAARETPTEEQARSNLYEVLNRAGITRRDLDDATLVSRAKRLTHPDLGGDAAQWAAVTAAAKALGVQS